MTRSRTAAAGLAALLVVLGLALPAAAHTELTSTAPAADAVVQDPPIEVVLTFTAAPQADPPPAVRVVDPNGDDIVAAPPTLDGTVVTAPLNLAVTPGEHVVDWAITAPDGDDQRGSFTFTFAPPSEIATPPDASPPPTATPTPTPTTTPTPTATPTPDITAPAEPDPSPSEVAVADDGGISPLVGGLVVLLAVAAVGAVVVARGRGLPGGDGA